MILSSHYVIYVHTGKYSFLMPQRSSLDMPLLRDEYFNVLSLATPGHGDNSILVSGATSCTHRGGNVTKCQKTTAHYFLNITYLR